MIISAVYPYPRDNGKRVVLAGLVDYFSDRYGAEALEYVWITRDSTAINLASPKARKLAAPPRLQQGLNAGMSILGASPRSIQEAVLYSSELVEKIQSILDDVNPDLVVADTFRIGQLLVRSEHRARTVMYMDDLFSLRYERMLAVREQGYSAGFNAIGNFGSVVPRIWTKFAAHPRVESALLRFEMGRTKQREVEVADEFPLNLLINEDEARKFQSRLKQAKVATIKPIMNVDSTPLPRTPSEARPQFVLLGDLRIAHNRHATLAFLKQMVDELRRMIPRVQIKIVGRGMDDELASLITVHADVVEYLGFVESLDQLLSETTALIVPLQFGTGVKIKTLEALARGIPIVSTGYGVEGIPGADAACIVDDDIAAFPEHMRRLTDPTVNQEFSERGLLFYRQQYSRASVTAEYDSLFEPWLGGR